MPMPADTSQVSVPTFTDDWARAGEGMNAAKATAALKDATLRIVIFGTPPGARGQTRLIDAA
jgi:hypothetical protein